MKDHSGAEWVDPEFGWVPRHVPEFPDRILLDLATACNLRCPMCEVWGSNDVDRVEPVKGVMDLEAMLRALDEVASAGPLLQPSMWGEPLIAPGIRERLLAMKKRGLAVAMNTNGLALSTAMAEFLVETEVDAVMVSVDAASPETLKKVRGIGDLERVEAAVVRLLQARGERDLPRIGVSFTIQEANRHELTAFLERWVGVVDVVRTGLVFENGRFPGMPRLPERTPCPALYRTLPIHNDGTASICCLDGFRAVPVGNVFEKGVREVWHGEEFAKVRYLHETGQWEKVPFCRDCNGWAQYAFADEVADGILIRRSPEYTYYNRIDRLENWQGSVQGGHAAPSVAVQEERSSA